MIHLADIKRAGELPACGAELAPGDLVAKVTEKFDCERCTTLALEEMRRIVVRRMKRLGDLPVGARVHKPDARPFDLAYLRTGTVHRQTFGDGTKSGVMWDGSGSVIVYSDDQPLDPAGDYDSYNPLESSESNVERSHRIRDMLREAERVNRIIEAALALSHHVRVGDQIIMGAFNDVVLITPELWARIEARR